MPVQWKDNKKGISIIEILIVIAIITTALVSLLGIASFSLRISTQIKENTLAVNLSQEAMEAVRNIRDSDWTKLTNGNHGLTNTGGYWDFAGTENVINGFTRTILIENTSRDPTTDDIEITYNPANDDTNTKKVTITVSWKNKEIEIVTYLTNWK
jgi:type II secretory pathway pseudopilin PulG